MTSCLNFDTEDCHVVGGCDLYTTKAVGSDKKLYKDIENQLQEQFQSVVRLSASLSPPAAAHAAASLNLSRSSPFGSFTNISSRRTYAYLIATLNASNPDYDFSHVLRPSDFRRVRGLKKVMSDLDSTMYNLRPRRLSEMPREAATAPEHKWSPRCWALIDRHMSLRDCNIYTWVPEDDPWDGEESIVWSTNYFFFNKARKRVCYLYVRGKNPYSASEDTTPLSTSFKMDAEDQGWMTPDMGANKRAKFWLGDRNHEDVPSLPKFGSVGTETDESVFMEDEDAPPSRPVVDEHGNYVFSDDETRSRSGSKDTVRDVSEELVESMEM